MIEIIITPEIIVRAEEMFKSAQSNAGMRFRKEKASGNTTWTGVLGQAVFEKALRDRLLP